MWIILRTDHAKERVVAAAVERMEWPCWVPLEVRHGRAHHSRQTPHRKIMERPLMPKTVFAAIPLAEIQSLQRVRYFQGIMRDVNLAPALVPDIQVAQFRAIVDRVNAARRAEIERFNRKKDKPLKINIAKLKDEKDLEAAIKAIKDRCFGSAAMEDAA